MCVRGIIKSRSLVRGLTLICLVGHGILVGATHSHSILNPSSAEPGVAAVSSSNSQITPYDEGCPSCQLQRSLTGLYAHPASLLPNLLWGPVICHSVAASEHTNGSSVTF